MNLSKQARRQHDINNMITTLLLVVDLTEHALRLPDEDPEKLRHVNQSLSRLRETLERANRILPSVSNDPS